MSILRRFRQSSYIGLAYLSKSRDCLGIDMVGGGRRSLAQRLINPLSVMKIPHCYLLFANPILLIEVSYTQNPRSASIGRQHTAEFPLVIALLRLSSLYTRLLPQHPSQALIVPVWAGCPFQVRATVAEDWGK